METAWHNNCKHNKKISTKSIHRRLSLEFGLKSCKLARKPCFTRAMKKKHTDFTKRHASWDIDIEIETFLEMSYRD